MLTSACTCTLSPSSLTTADISALDHCLKGACMLSIMLQPNPEYVDCAMGECKAMVIVANKL